MANKILTRGHSCTPSVPTGFGLPVYGTNLLCELAKFGLRYTMENCILARC